MDDFKTNRNSYLCSINDGIMRTDYIYGCRCEICEKDSVVIHAVRVRFTLPSTTFPCTIVIQRKSICLNCFDIVVIDDPRYKNYKQDSSQDI